ncbi:hypothetical protein [Chelativorans salis]|uniref:Uncharacterized protein n=1 Tax=Chelativorans salis TaxID=2978478 RepID=A0ABT2LYT7_9HYPH|nr:hypothetical protein [Chelativorans sp. EGI FJ00035]MCT7378364.1 hypothetical protein [Chelativorans sp. EGI FJ00035]
MQPEPERATDRAAALTRLQMGMVGAFNRAQILRLTADQIRRHGQQFEIAGNKPSRFIGTVEPSVCLSPGACFIGLAALLDLGAHVGQVVFRDALTGFAHWFRSTPGASGGSYTAAGRRQNYSFTRCQKPGSHPGSRCSPVR